MLQAMHKSEEDSLEPKEFGGIMKALRELLRIIEQMHRCHASFGAACWGSVRFLTRSHQFSVPHQCRGAFEHAEL